MNHSSFFRFLSACWPIPISSDGKVNRSASSHIQIHRRLTTFYCIFVFKMKNVSIWFNPPKCSTRREHRQLKQYQSIWTIKYEIRSHSVFNCNIGNVVFFLNRVRKRDEERERERIMEMADNFPSNGEWRSIRIRPEIMLVEDGAIALDKHYWKKPPLMTVSESAFEIKVRSPTKAQTSRAQFRVSILDLNSDKCCIANFSWNSISIGIRTGLWSRMWTPMSVFDIRRPPSPLFILWSVSEWVHAA